MADQFSLFGDDAPPSSPAASRRPLVVPPQRKGRRHSLFFALPPSLGDAQAIVATGRHLAHASEAHGQPLEAERLHVSLHALGEYADAVPEDFLGAMMAAADTVQARAFDVVFDRAASFPNAHALVLKSASDEPLAPLHAFHRTLGIALADAGLPLKNRRMTPHMTLAYEAVAVPEIAIEPVRWRAREFVLIDSLVGEHVHLVLGRWPLKD